MTALEKPRNHDHLRIGILGAAGIAPAAIIAPARLVDGVDIAAIAARDPERAREFAAQHGIPTVYASYEELLADPSIDAVYNPTPNGLHGRWTIAALRAGKHVLCEKPFTANAVEARGVASVARESGLVVMEAFHYRYHPLMTRIIEIIESGELGVIRSYHSGFGGSGPRQDDIRWHLALAGGALMDVGCYPVHLIRTLAKAEPTVTSAVAHTADPGVDGDFEIDFALPDGVTAHVSTSMWSETSYIDARIEGDLGTLDVTNPFLPHEGNSLVVRTAAGERTESATTETSYYFQLLAFVAAIRHGDTVLTGPEDSIATMEVIDHAYVAAGLEPREPTRY
jgi:predicted dehydrogenase